MKRFFFIFLTIASLSIGSIIYFSVLPPRVIETIASLSEPLTIKFDKPVDRQQLQTAISPEAPGEWKFEDPLVKNHLFTSLVFTPAVDLKPDTRYQVKLEKITSPVLTGFLGSFAFDFKTETAVSKKANSGSPEKITLLDIPLDWQDYPLSCEAASLKMALAGKGVYVSEDEIMQKMGYDAPLRRNNILWGDPYNAYVGDISGKMCDTGYGAYWEPVARTAGGWREVQAFSGWNLRDLANEIKAGNPVIVWGVMPTGSLTDCSWVTPEAKYIKAYRETHVRLAVGYIGDAENPSKIIINDPLAGRLYWSASFFLTNWKVFNYSGVAVR